jgi:hypothetical protein
MGAGFGGPARPDERIQAELDRLAVMPIEVLAGIVLTVFIAGETSDPTLSVGDIIKEFEGGLPAPRPTVLFGPLSEAIFRLSAVGLLQRGTAARAWRITDAGLQALTSNNVARLIAAPVDAVDPGGRPPG